MMPHDIGGSPPPHHHLGFLLIAVFKLIKSVLLVIAAIGLIKLIHGDASALLTHWITVLRGDPDNRMIHKLIAHIAGIQPHRLEVYSAGSFFYSALLFTEGVGLWFEYRWGKYFSLIITSTFIPMEIYEMARRFTFTRVAVFLINLGVIGYLVWHLRREGEFATHSLKLQKQNSAS